MGKKYTIIMAGVRELFSTFLLDKFSTLNLITHSRLDNNNDASKVQLPGGNLFRSISPASIEIYLHSYVLEST